MIALRTVWASSSLGPSKVTSMISPENLTFRRDRSQRTGSPISRIEGRSATEGSREAEDRTRSPLSVSSCPLMKVW
jgi:hypothetical protein